MKTLIYVLLMVMLPLMGIAQEVVPVVEPSWLDKAYDWVIGIDSSILMGGAVAVEFIFRFIKTEKPKSFLYMLADGISKVGAILTKSGEMLDKVLPQRVK